ncbi:MAG: PA2779 family protein [Wenzhouxiangellaceae bacterium]|nr:PA2779 family protein [Wenzhouxiangellaceae bacterium]
MNMTTIVFRNFVIALALASIVVVPARAQMVSTGDALALEQGRLEARIEAFLLREDVAAELAELGVSHEMAMARVAKMSAAELEQVAGRIDEMPAAGDGVFVVLGVVFFVLIVLELVGVINIFKAR